MFLPLQNILGNWNVGSLSTHLFRVPIVLRASRLYVPSYPLRFELYGCRGNVSGMYNFSFTCLVSYIMHEMIDLKKCWAGEIYIDGALSFIYYIFFSISV